LEQFHDVARQVLEQDLPAAGAGHDVVAEGPAGVTEAFDLGVDVVDDAVNPVPTARLGLATVGIGRPAELSGPASTSCKFPPLTSANASDALVKSSKPSDGSSTRWSRTLFLELALLAEHEAGVLRCVDRLFRKHVGDVRRDENPNAFGLTHFVARDGRGGEFEPETGSRVGSVLLYPKTERLGYSPL
jgi:hypothetical protein